jgi:hypothetical protein
MLVGEEEWGMQCFLGVVTFGNHSQKPAMELLQCGKYWGNIHWKLALYLAMYTRCAP